MLSRVLFLFLGVFSLLVLNPVLSYASKNKNIKPISIVAAENFYGAIAKQIGGKYVRVNSILSNPDADPHFFSTSVNISKEMSKADIIIYNGVGYDVWINPLIKINKNNNINKINISQILQIQNGSNPHLWYKPETFPKLAKYLANIFIGKFKNDNKAKLYFENNLNNFLAKNKILQKKIKAIKSQYNGMAVTATEPVFGYMANALGFKVLGLDFQWKIMNETDPSPKTIANYEDLLINKKVKILFYNNQVSNSLVKNILDIAKANHINIVGVSEIMPDNTQDPNVWFESELNTLQKSLASLNKT